MVKLTAEHTIFFSNSKIPYIVPNADLAKVYPVGKKMFTGKTFSEVPFRKDLTPSGI